MCKAKVIKLGDKNEESAQDSEHYLREIIKHKQENIKDLSKAKINMSKINQIMFGGVPDEELSTSFQKFIDESTIQKIEKSNEWKVIGRVKIKPPNGEIKDGKERVERVYLDQFSAHKILKVLPTLPSLC